VKEQPNQNRTNPTIAVLSGNPLPKTLHMASKFSAKGVPETDTFVNIESDLVFWQHLLPAFIGTLACEAAGTQLNLVKQTWITAQRI
jgi:hypothetical protein